MTILDLVRKLLNDTHVFVRYNDDDEILDFWPSDYYMELINSQDKKIIEYTEVVSFDFEDKTLIIFVDDIQFD